MYMGCPGCKHLNRNAKGMSCKAFPTKVPLPIVSGEVEHTKPMFGQKNNVVFEPSDDWAKPPRRDSDIIPPRFPRQTAH